MYLQIICSYFDFSQKSLHQVLLIKDQGIIFVGNVFILKNSTYPADLNPALQLIEVGLGNGDCGSAAISAAPLPGSAARVLPLIPTFASLPAQLFVNHSKNGSNLNEWLAEAG